MFTMKGMAHAKADILLPNLSAMYENAGVNIKAPMQNDEAMMDISCCDGFAPKGELSFSKISKTGDSHPIVVPQQNEIRLTIEQNLQTILI